MAESQDPKKTIPETEIGNSGVGNSEPKGAGSQEPTSAQLVELLKSQQATIKSLAEEVKLLKDAKSQPDSVEKLADALAKSINKSVENTPVNNDVVNRSSDYMNVQVSVDSQSRLDAQSMLYQFRGEQNAPVSVPKSLADTVGPNLVISVNGIRISLPCDGKTYYIPKSMAEHIREKIAKIENFNTKQSNNVVEIGERT